MYIGPLFMELPQGQAHTSLQVGRCQGMGQFSEKSLRVKARSGFGLGFYLPSCMTFVLWTDCVLSKFLCGYPNPQWDGI